jgi:hypothetical protein
MSTPQSQSRSNAVEQHTDRLEDLWHPGLVVDDRLGARRVRPCDVSQRITRRWGHVGQRRATSRAAWLQDVEVRDWLSQACV